MERRGLGPQADSEEADTLWHDKPLLAELYSESVRGRIVTGPRAGRRVARVGDAVDVDDAALPPGVCCAAVAGHSVDAGVCVPARDRMRTTLSSEGRRPDFFFEVASGSIDFGNRSRCDLEGNIVTL
jgi:hypothetical protein